jgi:hypothetical protein
MRRRLLVPVCLCAVAGVGLSRAQPAPGAPPSLDDLWAGTAHFSPVASFDVGSPGFAGVDAGTRVVVVNGTWFLFGRADAPATPACQSGMISINVRASVDKGRSWGPPSPLATPDGVGMCIFADGSAFFDAPAGTWHYLAQSLPAGAASRWALSHFSLVGASPLGAWTPDPHNPVVTGGQLFNQICAGADKHCELGMVDEGTPEIVEKVSGDFIVTFHGYDYGRKRSARGVARTPDFATWAVTGGAGALPGDVIFSAADCAGWSVPWAAPGGCIGSGEASVLRAAPSGFLYEVIEVADKELGCETGWDSQWWPLGLVRSAGWAPSTQWEQMRETPFVGGPAGGEPHVGCSIQYNSLHVDDDDGTTFFAFWHVSFHPANASLPAAGWHLYELAWGAAPLPMQWPGPAQRPPAPVDCSTKASCESTCPGFVECAADGYFYCCADAVHCAQTHDCAGNAGLHFCSCGPGGARGGG